MHTNKKSYAGLFAIVIVAMCVVTLAMNKMLGYHRILSLSFLPALITHVLTAAVPVKAYIDEIKAHGDVENKPYFTRCALYSLTVAGIGILASVLAVMLFPTLASKLMRLLVRGMLGLAFISGILVLMTNELKTKS